jgi:UDP-N-acetylglucosamine 2-epimerase (non-hydrolysing)
VAHVEAGLRTGDLDAPFPEEMNRTATSRIATLHFAPTQGAADNLLREGIPANQIEVTGNTGVDALISVRDRLESGALAGWQQHHVDESKLLVAVTAHRRESFGSAFRNICLAVADIATRPDVQVVWPVHRNPNVQDAVNATLLERENVILTEPLPYVPFVDLLRRATIILTDSGGIQEEAPSLGKPVLVLRDKTERPEAVAAGTVKLVGSNRETIVRECNRLLDDPSERERMAHIHNPYGDGRASGRIARTIAAFLADHNVR